MRGAVFNGCVWVPIGLALGPRFADQQSEEPESLDVRIGQDFFHLDYAQYAIWSLAHGLPELVQRRPRRAHRSKNQALRAGIENPDVGFNALVDGGLVAKSFSGGAVAAVCRSFTAFCPLSLGLGNSQEQPEAFTMGMPEQVRVTRFGAACYWPEE